MNILNPVLPGFHPDPSIVRVGAEYLVATSTFEWFPGIRLHRSPDLVTWEPAGHALTRPSQLDLRGVPDSGGVWAPSLSFADGTYWLVYSVVRTLGNPYKDLDNYLVTAPAAEGPWSEPTYLNSSGFDPSLFHDDDGRHYLLNIRWDHRAGHARFGGILLQEFDADAGRLVGSAQVIATSDELIEGPDLYKRAGEYVLMLAEGGTGDNHGIRIARASSIDGPYTFDAQPLLTTRDVVDVPDFPLRKAGHGSLVETPDGQWYLAHLASRPLRTRAGRRSVLGRETCLQRVVWDYDGWLRLAHGGHHPTTAVPAPAAPDGVSAPAPASDLDPVGATCAETAGFDSAGLSEGWISLRRPIGSEWADLASRPGWLRLSGGHSPQSLFDQSLVARRLVDVRCTVRTAVDFDPSDITQMAGLICYYDTRGFFYLRLTHDSNQGRVLGVVASDAGVAEEITDVAVPSREEWPVVHLRADIDGEVLRLRYSGDGADWRPIGPELDASTLSDDHGDRLRFTGAVVGLSAQDLSGRTATADFHHFSVVAL